MKFQHDYIQYDELGVARIVCMNCEAVVAERQTERVTLNTDPPESKLVERFVQLPNFRQIRVVISNGSFVEPIVCKDCDSIDIDGDGEPDIAEALRAQIERAALIAAKHQRSSASEIKEIKDNHKFEVLKKKMGPRYDFKI